MAQEQQTRRIVIQVDAQGDRSIRSLVNGVSSMNKELKKSSSILSSFQNLFNSILGASFLGVGASSLINVADSMQKLNDRLITLTGNSENAQRAFDGLRQVAKNTNSSIEDTLTVFSRLNLSMGDLGLSTNAILGITQTLQQTFRLSGSTAAEATAATIQLSQGLASGTLRGQELRSVLEQNAVIGELLAKSFGVQRGELLKLAEAGKFTSDKVLKALAAEAENLNEKAQQLRPTIGEELTKALDDLKVSFFEFNKEVGGSEKAIGTIKFLSENLSGLLAIAAAFATYAFLPTLLGKIGAGILLVVKGIGVLVGGFLAITAAANPLSIALISLGGAITGIFTLAGVKSGGLSGMFKAMADSMSQDLFPNIKQFLNYLSEIGTETKKLSASVSVDMEAIGKASQGLYKSIAIPDNLVLKASGLTETIQGLKEGVSNTNPIKAFIDEVNKLNIAIKKKPDSISKQIKDLNEQFAENGSANNVQKYNEKLLKLTEALNKPKGLKKVFEETGRVQRESFARELEYGLITIEQYQAKLNSFNADRMRESFERGYISISEFQKSVAESQTKFTPNSALFTGTEAFLNRIGTVTQNVGGLIENTFVRLEDSLVNFIETGKFRFADFAKSVIQEINRIILRALIIRPLAQGVLSFAGAETSTQTSYDGFHQQAKGGVWNKGVQMFAKGGVVDSPTMFGMRGSKLGVMGEAGSEAIMPLRRTSSGDLGVQASGMGSNVVVNIINQSGNEVQQTESTAPDGTKMIDVLITAKVKEGIARGDFDRTFGAAYGLRRKGT